MNINDMIQRNRNQKAKESIEATEGEEKFVDALLRKTKDSGDDYRRGLFTEAGKATVRVGEKALCKKLGI